MRRTVFSILLALVVLLPRPAAAQDPGDAGITMGYPASIGVLWHATDRVAVRPEFSFSHSSGETDNVEFGFSTSATTLATGVSVLFYVREWDKLRTYVAPRYSFARTKSETDSAPPILVDSETTSTTHSFTGLFGVQYSLHDRFSVFGEVGVGFSHGTGNSNLTETKSSSDNIATRTGVGLVFYF
jgi:opacity protein-like surface antigen